ncbi:hypothetical protein [Natrialba aegyptia]|uniref:Uncharacterized protein n=1 Tax=Natrialba aegyptia DSM 13077 TaxID=1227491 RepID=M0ART6_9EURY|nr:hypothetical protein [Natrialba aegyptia]ELZ01022.1 hypothetical protein C480_18297 [Natrialba aegyptia DSM 13077]
MEIVGRTVRDRVEQAFVVFIVFLAFDYFQNEIEWFGLLVSVSLFFVLMIGFDAIGQKFEE